MTTYFQILALVPKLVMPKSGLVQFGTEPLFAEPKPNLRFKQVWTRVVMLPAQLGSAQLKSHSFNSAFFLKNQEPKALNGYQVSRVLPESTLDLTLGSWVPFGRVRGTQHLFARSGTGFNFFS